MDEDPLGGTIELALPADTRMVRLARLVASGIASTAGFDIEEIEDLRIAVDEGCIALIEEGDGEPLRLSFALVETAVEVHGSTVATRSAGIDPQRLSLSDQILEVVTDDHELATADGEARFRFRKQSRATTGSDAPPDVG